MSSRNRQGLTWLEWIVAAGIDPCSFSTHNLPGKHISAWWNNQDASTWKDFLKEVSLQQKTSHHGDASLLAGIVDRRFHP